VILKKLPKKLGDPGKFLISYGFSKLKCKALADLERSSSPPHLGKTFLRTTHALIDIHREEMILHDGDERLTLNMRHDTSSYSNQHQRESINMINIYDDSCEDYLEDLFAKNHLSGNPTCFSHTDLTSPKVKDDIFAPEGDIFLIQKSVNLDSTKDLPPPQVINPLSGNTTSSSPNHLLEEFVDGLALITFPPRNDDLLFDIESDLREIEYLLNHDPTKEMDSILKDLVDECNLANPNVNLVDTILEMFTDEHTLDYAPPLIYDDFDDDLFELESNNDDTYDDPFDSKGEKIKYILIHENLSEDTVQVTPNKNVKKISISYASLILEDFDPPLYDLPFHKEVLDFKTLLSFSSKNEEKVFKPRILSSKGVHTSLLLEYLIGDPKLSDSLKILKARWRFFLAPMERTSIFWMFLVSISIPQKQINLRDFSDVEDSCSWFCPLITRSSHPQLHYGNPIS
nr:hypothetical protein [Tanacetum cinerariifolium]